MTKHATEAHLSIPSIYRSAMKKERKTAFEMPYVGIDHYQGMSILYGDRGDFSVVMRLTNPVLQYGADPEAYTTFQQVLLNVIKILGEGHIIQKHDVFIKRKYRPKPEIGRASCRERE